MPLHGQASGGWTESSSALRILNLGVRNTLATLTDDAFTQSNPTAVATNVSTRVDTTIHGVLSGSVCFARPDAGPYDQFVGGPGSDAVQTALAASPLWRQAIGPWAYSSTRLSATPMKTHRALPVGLGRTCALWEPMAMHCTRPI